MTRHRGHRANNLEDLLEELDSAYMNRWYSVYNLFEACDGDRYLAYMGLEAIDPYLGDDKGSIGPIGDCIKYIDRLCRMIVDNLNQESQEFKSFQANWDNIEFLFPESVESRLLVLLGVQSIRKSHHIGSIVHHMTTMNEWFDSYVPNSNKADIWPIYLKNRLEVVARFNKTKNCRAVVDGTLFDPWDAAEFLLHGKRIITGQHADFPSIRSVWGEDSLNFVGEKIRKSETTKTGKLVSTIDQYLHVINNSLLNKLLVIKAFADDICRDNVLYALASNRLCHRENPFYTPLQVADERVYLSTLFLMRELSARSDCIVNKSIVNNRAPESNELKVLMAISHPSLAGNPLVSEIVSSLLEINSFFKDFVPDQNERDIWPKQLRNRFVVNQDEPLLIEDILFKCDEIPCVFARKERVVYSNRLPSPKV